MSEATSGRSTRLSDVLLFAWAVLGAQVLFKFTFLYDSRGIGLARRAMGLPSLSYLDILAFYGRDILESLVIVPLVLLLLTWPLGTGARRGVCVALAQVWILLGIVGWGTHMAVGRFPTPSLIADYLHAFRANAAVVSPLTFLSWTTVVAGIAIAVLPLCVWLLLRFAPERVTRRGSLYRLILVPSAAAIVASSAGLALGHTGTVFHDSSMGWMLDEFLNGDGAGSELSASTHSREQLQAMYDSLVFPAPASPSATPAPAGAAAARHPNILLVVLETAAARDYDFLNPRLPWNNVRTLLPHSLVARQHFSSSASSSRADLTILSSLYDMGGTRSMAHYFADLPARRPDALPWILRNLGYDTRYYFPGDFTLAEDEWAVRFTGFEQIYHGAGELALSKGDHRVFEEEAMVDRVLSDMKTRRGRPFLAMVRTMIGHDPLIDPRAEGRTEPRPREELIRAIVSYEDELIGKLLAALDELGERDNTIVAIVGDHGIRMLSEVDLRFANQVSFQVPLLISAPGIPAMTNVDALTSHVDIVPTLLSLAGVTPERRWLQQGLTLTDPRLANRVSYFLSGDLLGSNAAHYQGRYYSRNVVTKMAFLSNKFEFADTDLVAASTNKEDVAFFEGRLRGLEEVQRAWVSYLLVPQEQDASTQEPSPAGSVSGQH